MISLTDSVFACVSEMNVPPTSKTIVVFDSGMGGLTVYDEIRQLLPHHRYLYVFDNGGFPYGEQPDDVIISRVDHIITMLNAHYPIDLAVIACNTASTITLPILREHFDFPIVGVVPAIKPAVKLTKNNHIGLLVTKATASRAYIHELINAFASHAHVDIVAHSELAIMAENKLKGEPVDKQKLAQLFSHWLQSGDIPDTIVLGCTHYPLLKAELSRIFPKNTQFVDSGEAIAKRVNLLLNEQTSVIDDNTQQNLAFCTEFNQVVFNIYAPILANFDLFLSQDSQLFARKD